MLYITSSHRPADLWNAFPHFYSFLLKPGRLTFITRGLLMHHREINAIMFQELKYCLKQTPELVGFYKIAVLQFPNKLHSKQVMEMLHANDTTQEKLHVSCLHRNVKYIQSPHAETQERSFRSWNFSGETLDWSVNTGEKLCDPSRGRFDPELCGFSELIAVTECFWDTMESRIPSS